MSVAPLCNSRQPLHLSHYMSSKITLPGGCKGVNILKVTQWSALSVPFAGPSRTAIPFVSLLEMIRAVEAISYYAASEKGWPETGMCVRCRGRGTHRDQVMRRSGFLRLNGCLPTASIL